MGGWDQNGSIKVEYNLYFRLGYFTVREGVFLICLSVTTVGPCTIRVLITSEQILC
jgi:hypothetical protein